MKEKALTENIGQFSFNGDCTFAIPIRSIFIYGKKVMFKHAVV